MILSMQGSLQKLYCNHVLTLRNPAIMQYRICCMYKRSRRIVVLVVGAFIVEMLSMLAIDFLYLLHITGEIYFIAHRKLDCLPTPQFLQ